jgi:dsRNA-specific ribonuclease
VPLFTKSNERLEFMGGQDSGMYNQVLPIQTVSQGNEGFMTEKIALVKNESIGRMAYEMGLHNWFIISKYAETKQVNFKKLGCLFEAFLEPCFWISIR